MHRICILGLFTLWLPLLSSASVAPVAKVLSNSNNQKIQKITKKLFDNEDGPELRVLIQENLSEVNISGRDIRGVKSSKNSGKRNKNIDRIIFNCSSTARATNVDKHLFASLASPTGVLNFDGQIYKGELQVLANGQKKNCELVNKIRLEDYIPSLLSKEMNGTWPVEVLKAQAVAARSYALNKILESESIVKENLFDLVSSEKDQVSGGLLDSTQNTIEAANSTKGEVLVGPDGKVVPIFFHAACGGRTWVPQQVWESKVSGYESRPCVCLNRKKKESWDSQISMGRFKEFINWLARNRFISPAMASGSQALDFKIEMDSDRYAQIVMKYEKKPVRVNKALFRRYFGRVMFPSNNFVIKANNNGLQISGYGRGHGVGLCQIGALEFSKMGWDYKKILAHYFPRHQLEKIY